MDGDSPESGHEQEKGTGVVEQGKGTRKLTIGQSGGSSSSVQASKPAQRKAPLTHLPLSTKPAPKPAYPAAQIAAWFYELIGEPAREEKAARTERAGTFRPLVERYGAETVKAVITWASLSEFWGDKLRRRDRDSADHALDKFPTWRDQWVDESERATKKKPQSPSASTPAETKPTMPPMIRPENKLHF